MLQCPPVVVMGVPATMRRGPGMMPSSIACLMGNATWLRAPKSRMVVTPDESAERTAPTARIRKTSSDSVMMCAYASSCALQCMCECISMKPGMMLPPLTSITSTSSPGANCNSSCVVISVILPFSITIAPFDTASAPVPSISRSAFSASFISALTHSKLWISGTL